MGRGHLCPTQTWGTGPARRVCFWRGRWQFIPAETKCSAPSRIRPEPPETHTHSNNKTKKMQLKSWCFWGGNNPQWKKKNHIDYSGKKTSFLSDENTVTRPARRVWFWRGRWRFIPAETKCSARSRIRPEPPSTHSITWKKRR